MQIYIFENIIFVTLEYISFDSYRFTRIMSWSRASAPQNALSARIVPNAKPMFRSGSLGIIAPIINQNYSVSDWDANSNSVISRSAVNCDGR